MSRLLSAALLAAALAALAAGAWLTWQVASGSYVEYTGSHPRLRFQGELLDVAREPLLLAGIAGVLGWLLLGALGATRPRGAAAQETAPQDEATAASAA